MNVAVSVYSLLVALFHPPHPSCYWLLQPRTCIQSQSSWGFNASTCVIERNYIKFKCRKVNVRKVWGLIHFTEFNIWSLTWYLVAGCSADELQSLSFLCWWGVMFPIITFSIQHCGLFPKLNSAETKGFLERKTKMPYVIIKNWFILYLVRKW